MAHCMHPHMHHLTGCPHTWRQSVQQCCVHPVPTSRIAAPGSRTHRRVQVYASDASSPQSGPPIPPALEPMQPRPPRDTADTSQRDEARAQRQKQRSARQGVLMPTPLLDGRLSNPSPPPLQSPAVPGAPQIIPGVVSLNEDSDAPETAALAQVLASVSDPQQREVLVRLMDARNDETLMAQFEALPDTMKEAVLGALYSPYNDTDWWAETLTRPLLEDILREELGPELSEIMDVLMGPEPGERSKNKSTGRKKRAPLPVSWSTAAWPHPAAMRKRLALLTAEQKQRLPELMAKIEASELAAREVGTLEERERQAAALRAQRRYLQLARRARQQGLLVPDLPEELARPFDPAAAGLPPFESRLAQPASAVEEEGVGGSTQGSRAGKGGSQNPSDRFAKMREVLESRGMIPPRISDSLKSSAAAAQQRFNHEFLNINSQPHATATGAAASIPTPGAHGSSPEPGSAPGEPSTSADSATTSPSASTPPGGDTTRTASGSMREHALALGLDSGMADLVERLDAVYRRYNLETGTGWEEEGHLGSAAMQCLKRAAMGMARAARISDSESLARSGMSESELSLLLEQSLMDLDELMRRDTEYPEGSGVVGVSDPAVRATLLYVRTQLLAPVPEELRQQVEELQEEGQPPIDPLYLPTDVPTTDKLLRFIMAAEAWEAFHSLAQSWGQRRPGLVLGTAMQDMAAVGAGDPRWWTVKEETNVLLPGNRRSDQSLFTRTDTSNGGGGGSEGSGGELDVIRANMRRRLERALKQIEGVGEGSGGESEGAGDDALVADEELIEALSTLDVGVLRCLQELDEYQYSNEILMKWSLHPVVGPRLSSGQPLMDLETVHPMFRELFEESQVLPVEGVDYEWTVRSASDPGARVVQAVTELSQTQGAEGAMEVLRAAMRRGGAQGRAEAVGIEEEEGEQEERREVMVGEGGKGRARLGSSKEMARRRQAARKRLSRR